MDADLTATIEEARARTLDGARPGPVGARHRRGLLTARERIEQLADPGSFVEYGQLADHPGRRAGESPAAGLVGGVGAVDGAPVVLASYDATVEDGVATSLNTAKVERLVSLACARRWPLVVWVDGGGDAGERPSSPNPGIGSGAGRFGLFDGMCELSGWAPTVAVVSGESSGPNVAVAMLADAVIATRGSSFGTGDAGTGDAGTSDAGAGTSTAVRHGVDECEGVGDVDLLVDDEAGAIDTVRRYLAYQFDLPRGDPDPGAAGIADLVPDNRRAPYDMRKVVRAFADAGSVLELRPRWARSLITAFARVEGRAVGILANQPLSSLAGAIDADAADKISRFVELCDAYELPLVSFVDNPGYMVGPRAERGGIARHHARPLSALHHRTVPLYSVQVRKAYGLGPSAMAGWGSSRLEPDLRLAWPSVESGGMSLEGAAFLVRRREIQAAATREEARAIQSEYAEAMRDQRSGLNAGRAFAFDDIVEPAATRARIARMLRMTPRPRSAAKKHYIDSI